VDTPSQTLDGRFVVDNSDGLLRPGMYAQVTLTGITASGLMAPASAVFQVGEQFYVFTVLGEGRFEPVEVEIGTESGGRVPILSGLTANVEVVSSGVAELKSHWQYQRDE
jgi:multidrug efflux pump subunit AcrA (membrane-fusion protein)